MFKTISLKAMESLLSISELLKEDTNNKKETTISLEGKIT